MKRNALIVGVVLLFLIGACAPQAAPTPSPVDIQHTAEAAAFTRVAQTLEAVPTHTSVPPTQTASPTLPPTLTSLPSPTGDPLLASATSLPTTVPTAIPQPSDGSTPADCNKALTAWEGPSASLSIKNETNPEGKLVLSLYVVTDLGECGYLADLSQGPVGQYSAAAFVDGKKDFKVFGGFRITQGNWKIVVRNDKIIAMGSCYPNC